MVVYGILGMFWVCVVFGMYVGLELDLYVGDLVGVVCVFVGGCVIVGGVVE